MAWNYARGIDSSVVGIAGDSGLATSIQIDTDWTFETAGKEAFFARFVAPVSQTNAALTLYVFCTAVTGTPTFGIEARNGALAAGDWDRPEAAGSTIGTPGSDITPTANRWATFTFSSITLVQSQTYFLIVKNTSADPVSDYASWEYRAAYEGQVGATVTITGLVQLRTGYTQSGFTTDPTLGSGVGLAVIKTSDGPLFGNSWASSTAHASNANDRGNRVQFANDTRVVGILSNVGNTNVATLEITRVSDNSVILSLTLDESAQLGGSTHFDVTLLKDVAYNIVVTVGGSTNAGIRAYMGESSDNLPADVLAWKPSWFLGFVGGSQDPSTYTLNDTLASPMVLMVDSISSGSSGGGLRLAGHGGLAG